jgi:tetratricopeptide (TPR) repeat protein
MNALVLNGFFTRAFSLKPLNAHDLALQGPDHVARSLRGAAAAWRYLLGAMVLRRAGLESEANDFLNHASAADLKDDVFSAEVLSEAGLALQKNDRLADAGRTLDSASAIWRDACQDALGACAKDAGPACVAFARRLLPLAEAAGVELPFSPDRLTPDLASRLVRRWLIERAVPRRAVVFYGFATVLARAGHHADARQVGGELLAWLEEHVARPPLETGALEAPIREAFYRMRLAAGEIELAAGKFAESAEAFAGAARVYEGHAVDAADVVWMLQAKFNEANSLLRLARYDEALRIYALVEHGFERFATPAALQRVQQAILFARMKKEEEGVG